MTKTASPAPDEGKALRETAKRWLQRITDAQKREKEWRDNAGEAVKAYTGEQGKSEAGTAEKGVAYDFNVLFANVETIVPAVINSPPAPDIRRRFGGDDPAARDFAELLERAIRVQVDDGRLQVEMEAMAQDGFLAGRGVIRLRFHGDVSEDTSPEAEASGAAAESLTNERIGFEAVSWKDAVHGPAKRWSDVPWWAFRHVMEREDLAGFVDGPLVASQVEGEEKDEEDEDRIVWEIWDRRSRSVLFVSEKEGGLVLKRVDDPLGLSSFFPVATPVQPIEINGRLMPVNPFSIYRRLADELDTTTKRIRIITKQLKVKGWYGFDPTALAAALEADDNEFVAIPDPEVWATNGGLQNAIIFWPVEKLIVVLAELYKLREQTKQAIYEITGISDIVRGASRSSETATAQQIKSQWGSLRIQKMQRMMERAARDLFLMMAEIIPTKFSLATLEAMTEIRLQPTQQEQQPIQAPPVPPPQPGQQPDPQAAEIAQQAQAAEQERQKRLAHYEALQGLMQKKAATYYRIDVETDSTVKADLTRQKAEASEFMNAASGYFSAVAPLVQQGALPMNVAVEIFSSFGRMFNLGKTVEDALDELVSKAKEQAGQPAKPDPAAEAAKAEAEAKNRAAEMDMQLKQLDGQIKAQAGGLEIEGKKVDLEMKRMELETRRVMQPFAALAGQAGPFGGQSRG